MAAKSYIVAPGVYITEGTMQESYIVAPGVYINETSIAGSTNVKPFIMGMGNTWIKRTTVGY